MNWSYFLTFVNYMHISLLCAFSISFNTLERWLSSISVLFVDFQENGNAQNWLAQILLQITCSKTTCKFPLQASSSTIKWLYMDILQVNKLPLNY
jgi:hypothetical protein